MDLTPYLSSRGDDEPSGENLEYDPAFISLELAAQPGEERQVGDSKIAAEEPDHDEVIRLAVEVLERAHDIRAAVFLAHSLTRTQGFAGFADVTAYVRGVLTDHWDTCHPQLDADDDNDPTMRVNAVRSLADPDTVLRALRMAPMTDSRAFGRISLRDSLIAEGEISPPDGAENLPDSATISAAFQDTAPQRLQDILDAVDRAAADIKAIGAIFDDKVPGYGPDLDDLTRLLRQVQTRFRNAGVGGAADAGDAGAEDEGAADAGGAPAAGGSAGGVARGVGGVPGAINSQQDVRTALEKIIAYYAKNEPSSPLPMILERCKNLVGADFVTIIKDIAPRGYDEVKTIGGFKDENDY